MELLSLVVIAWVAAAIAIFLMTWLFTAPWFILLAILVVFLAALHFCMPNSKQYVSISASAPGIKPDLSKPKPSPQAATSSTKAAKPQATVASRPKLTNPVSAELIYRGAHYRPTPDLSPLAQQIATRLAAANFGTDTVNSFKPESAAVSLPVHPEASPLLQRISGKLNTSNWMKNDSKVSPLVEADTEEYVYVQPSHEQIRKVYSLVQRG
jgi:hypothetical protein